MTGVGGADGSARHLAEQARTLQGLLRAGALVLGAMVLISPFSGAGLREGLAIYGTGVALHVAHLGLLRLGRIRLVAISHCVLYLVWITGVLALRVGGLRAPAALVYPPLILMTGLVWSGRAAIGMALGSSMAGGALVLLERWGLLPIRHESEKPVQLWLVLTACVVITAVILRFALKIMRHSEGETLHSQERFADLVRAAPDAMFFATSEYGIEACNPAAAELAEQPAESLIGQRLDELIGVDDPQRQRLAEIIAGAARGRVEDRVELGFRRPDGTILPVEVRARHARRGGRSEVHVTIRDLRDRVKAEEERQRLEGQLRQAQRLEALGRMAGGVAHDFNNLLTIILGNIGLFPRHMQGVAEPAREIEAAAVRAAELSRQLLAFGRQQIFTPAIVDINEVLGGMESILRRLLPEDVALELRRAAGPSAISTDRVQIEQVILNLVVNARDAISAGGTITVTTSTVPPPALAGASGFPREAVWLTVADNGAGMTEEIKAHVFEPFFTTKEPMRGTGLGLATVHGIVTQTGGRIHIDSTQGTGTMFSIAFPRAAPDTRVEPPLPVRVRRVSPATILLVEDDPAVRTVGGAILSAGGYRVLLAGGAAEAGALTDGFDEPIDLLLTDVVLRGQSGPAIAAALRARRPDMKILFTSGHAEELIAQKGVLRAGVNFLSKPFTRESLLDRVAGVLASPARGELGADPASASRSPDQPLHSTSSL